MPDVSNQDLMKLIYHVIKKVDVIEQKLDQLLEEKEKVSNCFVPDPVNEAQHEIDYDFYYSPIKNANDLILVSKKIKHDEVYKRKFVSKSLKFSGLLFCFISLD